MFNMYSNITDLLDDQKFGKIIYYLHSKKIHSLDDLVNFDVEDLYFIPGVSVGLVEETENRINDYLKCRTSIAKTEISHALEKQVQVEEKEAIRLEEHQKALIVEVASQKREESTKNEVSTYSDIRIPIIVAYANHKKGAWFGNFCFNKGKAFMDQLVTGDFFELNVQRGVGATFKFQLEEIFMEYQASPSLFCERVSEFDLFLFAHQYFSPDTVRWLKSAGIRSIKAMRGFEFDYLFDIGRMNRTIHREITGFLHHVEGQPFTKMSREVENSREKFTADDIHPENMNIQLRVFTLMGLLSGADYHTLEARGFHIVGELCDRELDAFECSIVKRIIDMVNAPVLRRYLHAFESLPDAYRSILKSRAAGETLQEIGDRIGVSRERIRQIAKKATKRLINWAILLGGSLLGGMRRFISFEELLEVFDEQVHAYVCSLIYREYTIIKHLNFREKFDYFPQDVSVCEQLEMMARDLIGDGIDFYEQIDVIEDELGARGLGELDSEDFMDFLLYSGYQFYGDFVAVGQKASLLIYYDAIDRYFPLDIKLDSKEDNDDMKKLRELVGKRYPGFCQPENNRALTAMITRNPRIILSGPGTFRPISKVIYSISLLEEIRDYVENSTLPSLYFFELFELFKGRLLAETNIDSHHLLHGMLKYMFPEAFSYKRDKISKLGKKHLSLDDRIIQLIRNLGRPATKDEIREAIPGIQNFTITNAVERVPGLIQWDNNRFNHIDNIRINDYAKNALHECLKSLTSSSGYTSANLFYERIFDLYPQIVESNKIDNPDNLFYIASYYLNGEFRFNRKHITTLDFPVVELTLKNIARFFLGEKDSFTYQEFLELAKKHSWSAGSYYNTISSLESDYVRVSEDQYVKRELLHVSFSDQLVIKTQLEELTRPSGYFAFFSMFDYQKYPEIGLEWNSYLLESIIRVFDVGHRIIEPSARNRSVQRGVIVSQVSEYKTLNDLVFNYLQKNNISVITKQNLRNHLEKAGIIEGALVIDVESSPHWTIKGDRFYIK